MAYEDLEWNLRDSKGRLGLNYRIWNSILVLFADKMFE